MTRLTTLASGLRVVSREMPGLETAAVGLFADSGSRHEPAELGGLAHLFEHMVFKGAGGRSAREISEAIEDVGGELNACTERDGTSYTATVLAEHLPLAVELIADLVLRPHLAAEELAREKDVVLQELAEVHDTPGDLIFDELWSVAFEGQALGRSILGDAKSIGRISVDDLKSWQATRYRGGALVLVACGKVDHEGLVALAERKFGDLAVGAAEAAAPAGFTGGSRTIRGRSDQAHLTFAYPAPAASDPQVFAARLFADAIGGGASSRLFQELREERGLAYATSASISSYEDTGLLSVHAATSAAEAPAAERLIGEIIASAAADISQRELDRARNQAKAGLLIGLETNWGQMHALARQLAVYNRLVPVEEVLAKLEAVTVEDVRAAAARIVAGPVARASIGLRAARAA